MSHDRPDDMSLHTADAANTAATAGQGAPGAAQDPVDADLRRMNRELNQILGSEIRPGRPKERTKSQMKALRKERRKRRISIPLILLCILIILAGGAYGSYQYLKSQGRKSLLEHKQIEGVQITAPEEAEIADEGHTIKYRGKTYRRNEEVISILAMGIDEKSDAPEEHEIGENGQANTLFIAALNAVDGSLTLINISRDSIVDVDLYDVNGNSAGTEPMQICLAYAYGSDGKSSCENTIKSVSRLMYGMPIDAYGSISVPAISVLNDAIGGVEVTVLEDLGSGDAKLERGKKVTLMGKQVNTYVISRDLYDKEANNARMARQRQYLIGFINKAFSQIRKDLGTVFTLYDAIKSYMTTDITVARMTYLASLAMNGYFREQDIITVPGEVTVETGADGQPHAAYHVDDESLYQIILDVYYTEV